MLWTRPTAGGPVRPSGASGRLAAMLLSASAVYDVQYMRWWQSLRVFVTVPYRAAMH